MRALALKLLPAVAALAALAAPASATTPEALTQARQIRAELNARYGLLPGRKLAVTETSSTAVTESLTLVDGPFLHVVPARDGIYFAICTARARCPYPARSASWPAEALLPRRQALELALQTFVKTSASLVVVGLPTREPVWVVFERDELLATTDAPAVLDRLARDRTTDAPLRELVDRVTNPRLFRPVPILPLSHETLYATHLLET